MFRRPTISPRTDTLFPYTTLFRSHLRSIVRLGAETTPGMQNYESVLALAGPAQRARLDMVAAGLDPDEAINIQFTSGTTGLPKGARSEEHTSELQSLMRISYAVFCLKKKTLQHSKQQPTERT